MSEDLTTYKVYRGTWARGEGPDDSGLWMEDNCKCCLGHIGKQCGIHRDVLYRKSSPSDLYPREGMEFNEDFILFPIGIRPTSDVDETEISTNMMKVNDSKDLEDPERESQLQALAIQAGFRLEFTDEPEPQ